MKSYKELSRDELLELQGALNKEYADAKSKGLSLNMARGKPSPEQLGFSMGIMDVLNSSSELVSEDVSSELFPQPVIAAAISSAAAAAASFFFMFDLSFLIYIVYYCTTCVRI